MSERAGRAVLLGSKDKSVAFDVHTSCWVNASAGSGKTTALVGRIISLLVHGVTPEEILCLTFTQRAAKEMLHRLVHDVKEMIHTATSPRWILLLGREPIESEQEQLRRLWRNWGTQPVTIQTFHSFCHHLLGRFPVESVASMPLRLLDATQSMRVWYQSCHKIVEECSPEDDVGPLVSFLASCDVRVLEELKDIGPSGRLFKVPIGEDRGGLEEVLVAHQGNDGMRWMFSAKAPCVMAIPETEPTCPQERKWWEQCRNAINDPHALQKLLARMKSIKDPLLAQWHTRVKDELDQWQHTEHMRLETLTEQAKDRIWWKTHAHYAQLKNGALDFDDLISHTLRLLDESPYAGWALHTIHRTYRHVLVDEAQDTSVLQWRILRHVMEAVVCASARTVFVVGDSKQSIYGFQGADVEHFALMQDFTKAWVENQEKGRFATVHLDQSYRSSPVILQLVNRVFDPHSDSEHHQQTYQSSQENHPVPVDEPVKLPFFRHHHSAHPHRTGSVTLIPSGDCDVASHVSMWMDVVRYYQAHPLYLHSVQRFMRLDDVMILLPRRNSFYVAFEEALTQEGWLKPSVYRFAEHPTMGWLSAWLRMVVDPHDDQAVGTMMKGIARYAGESGQWLWDVAYQRKGQSLFQRMLHMSKDHHFLAGELMVYIKYIQTQCHHIPLVDLMTQWIYEEGGGTWLHHMNPETPSVSGAIDAWLCAFHAWSGDSTSFLQMMRDFNPPMEVPSVQGMKLMTIHGAKGAEAPVVILPDMPEPVTEDDPEHWRLLYVALTRAKDHLLMGSRSSKTPWYKAVHHGMTAIGTPHKISGVTESYRVISSCNNSGSGHSQYTTEQLYQTGQENALEYGLQEHQQSDSSLVGHAPEIEKADAVVDVCHAMPPEATLRKGFAHLLHRVMSVVHNGTSCVQDVLCSEPQKHTTSHDNTITEMQEHNITTTKGRMLAAKLGQCVHQLFDELPHEIRFARFDMAVNFLQRNGFSVSTSQRWARKVVGLLQRADLAPLFYQAFSEVEWTATHQMRRMDRVLVQNQNVWIVDFKTSVPPLGDMDWEHSPYGIQLQEYKTLIADTLPHCTVHAGILWVRTGELWWSPTPYPLCAWSVADRPQG